MVKKELYNVREHPQKGGTEIPFTLCSMNPSKNPYPQTVSSSLRIMSPSSSVFQALIQWSLTSALTVVKLIEAQLLDPLSINSLYWVRWAQILFVYGPNLKIVTLQLAPSMGIVCAMMSATVC